MVETIPLYSLDTWSKTSLNIIKNIFRYLWGYIPGCGQIDHQTASQCDCSIADAKKIKLDRQSDKITAEEIDEIESVVIKNWCTEIRRAIDFFYSTYPDDSFNQVILSGGGANIEGFL